MEYKQLFKGDYKPLFGTVSHDKGIFTLHYEKTDLCSAIYSQSYDADVFNGLKIPIIRFDKSPLDNVLECIKGEVAEIEEYYKMGPWSKPVTLDEYLNHIRACGVPVEIGYIN